MHHKRGTKVVRVVMEVTITGVAEVEATQEEIAATTEVEAVVIITMEAVEVAEAVVTEAADTLHPITIPLPQITINNLSKWITIVINTITLPLLIMQWAPQVVTTHLLLLTIHTMA